METVRFLLHSPLVEDGINGTYGKGESENGLSAIEYGNS